MMTGKMMAVMALFMLLAAGTTAQAAVCGNGTIEGYEECDGAQDAGCPGRCSAHCACPAGPVTGELELHMIDVGQGDGLVLVSPDGFTLFIDGGEENQTSNVLDYLTAQGITHLDYVLSSHEHSDHIGATDLILAAHPEVVVAFYNGRTCDSPDGCEFTTAAGARLKTLVTGNYLDLGPSVTAQVLHSRASSSEDNLNSIVLKVVYGNTSFLLGGDCEASCEALFDPDQIDVYKVHHHGSNDSSSNFLLDNMDATTGLISVGAGNPYGHPQPEAMARLAAHNVTVYRTDLEGDLVVISDGSTYAVNGTPLCQENATRSCGLTATGECALGVETCTGGSWGSCVGAVYPVDEACANGLDDDCDGLVDASDPDCAAPAAHVVFAQVGYDTPGTDSVEEYFELFNPNPVPVELGGWTVQDNVGTWTFPTGATIGAEEYLTVARNDAGYLAWFGKHPDLVGFSLDLGNSGDRLTLKNGSTEVDFVAWENSVSGWSIATPTGAALLRTDPYVDTDTVADWSVLNPAAPGGGYLCGNSLCESSEDPTSCPADCALPILDHPVIAQVGYDTPGDDAIEEFVDLYNPTAAAVALDGWTLTDNYSTWTFPAGTTIGANAYLSIARNLTGFVALYGKTPDLTGLTLALGNSGDSLTLSDGTNPIDYVAWEDAANGWGITAPTGDSIERTDPTTDTDLVADFGVTSPASPRGSACSDSDGDGVCDSVDGCPLDPAKTAPGACGCGLADADQDGDSTPDCLDGCPADPAKTAPGLCGCGLADVDTDGDGALDCQDGCPVDPLKTAPGVCGCGNADVDGDGDGVLDCQDGCPADPLKTAPGQCGCAIADSDGDGDATPDCLDGCPADPAKVAPGACGCGVAETDTDGDQTPDCTDGCPGDAAKTAPGVCGCNVADDDSDGDGTADCLDDCPYDPAKVAPGFCGCGVGDSDTDGDGTLDCVDGCPTDLNKVAPGLCGCGYPDTDQDLDGVPDCQDGCPLDHQKVAPGLCGCGVAETDGDGDGMPDCVDGCPADPAKTAPGFCGCGMAETDSDGDGTADCADGCPADSAKTAPGLCGCGVAETDSDGDGTPDCADDCLADPGKVTPGFCGCGVAETDSDGDGTPDCADDCPVDPAKTGPGFCGCGVADVDGDGDGIMDCVDPCVDDGQNHCPWTGLVPNVSTSAWSLVSFNRQFTRMVVVCTPNYTVGQAAVVTRVLPGAGGDSFQVRLNSTKNEVVAGVSVHCLVVDEGQYTLATHGVKMEAYRFTSTVTDNAKSWVGQSRGFQNSYTSPVVVGQVTGYNDPKWSAFWCRGNKAANPPAGSTLYVGKHVGEDSLKTRVNDEIGYIVIEAGSGTLFGQPYRAGLGADTIRGVGDAPPYTYSNLTGPANASLAVVSQAAMDGTEGGWAILYGAGAVSPTSLKVAIDEDAVLDAERSHTTEQVGYIVF